MIMSKPLVTEMLKFLNQKGTNEEATVEMTKLIQEISESLMQTRIQAQMFRRAAYYDSQAAHVPFQGIKEGGKRNQVGVDPDEFKRIIAGGVENNGTEGPESNITSSQSKLKDPSLRKSSQTDEGHVLNIGIVEIQPTGRSSSTILPDGGTNRNLQTDD